MGQNESQQVTNLVNDVLQASMSKVVNKNAFSLSVKNENVQVNRVNIIESKVKNCNLKQLNEIGSTLEVVTKISSESINELQTELQSEVSNKLEQISKNVNGLFGGVGTSNKQKNVIDIINRSTQIIQKDIRNENLTDIIANNSNFQQNILEIKNSEYDCGEKGEIVQLNKIQTGIILKTVVNNSVKNILDDAIISRIANDIKQSSTIENKGVDAIFSGLASIIIAIIIGVVIVFSVGAKAFISGLGKVGNILLSLLPLIATGTLAYLSGAYTWNFWPYQTSIEYWSCVKNSEGMVTGECRRVDNIDEGPFPNKTACEDAVKKGDAPCGQYWGCVRSKGQYGDIYTRGCKQYTNASLGPYKTKTDCDNVAKDVCKNNYVCAVDEKGLYVEPNICVPVLRDYSSKIEGTDEFTCKNNMFENCRNYWGIAKRGTGCVCVAFKTNIKKKIGSKEDVVFYEDVITKDDCEAKLREGCPLQNL